MPSATVRISEETHKTLRELASHAGETKQTVLDKAIEQYRRQRLFEEANAAYAALRADPEAWQAEQEEREVWDTPLMDGLDGEEEGHG